MEIGIAHSKYFVSIFCLYFPRGGYQGRVVTISSHVDWGFEYQAHCDGASNVWVLHRVATSPQNLETPQI